ncbi:NUDIX domain-containing protein [Streptomyces sp. bgisy084]|uniref:NUDIX domain-containing protein n=1 Tax=Streptomyces sp. bgisy084 TaxID=3413777 RepID=UPI003D712864
MTTIAARPQVIPGFGHLAPPRLCMDWPWCESDPVPGGLPVTQCWGWLFVPDGRCLVLIDTRRRLPMLPGGTVETQDIDPTQTLYREAHEEAHLAVGPTHYLGYLHDTNSGSYAGIDACARVRMAGPISHVGPSTPDPASGITMLRFLATPHRVVELFGWGEQGHQQADAAIRAANGLWNYPVASSSTDVQQVPLEGLRP